MIDPFRMLAILDAIAFVFLAAIAASVLRLILAGMK
jgi:hypothetical protein